MTTHADVLTYTEDTAAEALVNIMNALVQANADAAMLKRLQAAPALIIELTAQQDAVIAEQRTILSAKAKSLEDARFSRFGSISVTDTTPEEHVIRTSFDISWTALTWDSNAHVSWPQPVTMTGFQSVPHDVLAYLIERHPEKIPAKITSLAADLYDAFDRYFVAMKRGNLIGNSYDVQRANGA